MLHVAGSPDVVKLKNKKCQIVCENCTFVRHGIIHLVSTQNFPKSLHLLHPDTHLRVIIYVGVSGGKKCFSWSAYEVNGLSPRFHC